MNASCSARLCRVAYPFILAGLSACILIAFIRTVENAHVGINAYNRSQFLDMVNGTAYRPFVYRTLLPTIVRLISSATPARYRQAFRNTV